MVLSISNKYSSLSALANGELLKFPERFLWGAATSHFQVEGHPLECASRFSDWSEWTNMSGKIQDETCADQACEFYSRYKKDIELCKQLNLNAFRLSLNWPALCPSEPVKDGPIVLDKEMVDFYKKLLTELKDEGIKSFVTLFHFTLPNWLARKGGWTSSETAAQFARFTKAAAEAFDGLVDYWLTINEPLAYAYQGYVAGIWPPGSKDDYLGAFASVRGLLEGHALAFQELKAHNASVPVSFTHHWRPFQAKNQLNPLDHVARCYRDAIFNQLFPKAVQSGVYEFPFPFSSNDDIKRISGPIPHLKDSIDYLAVNYYTRELAQFSFTRPFDVFGEQSHEYELETSGLSWEVYPTGLFNLLTRGLEPFRRDSKGKERPIFVTENGYASLFSAELSEGDWSLADDRRVNYLISHLMAVYEAIKCGANVQGYLYWSLLDNFEWAEGLQARFGLVRVAYPTQERTMRSSAQVYADVARRNAIMPDAFTKMVQPPKLITE